MVRKRENIQWAAVVWTKMPCWCQRRMGRLVRDNRKATVTQITTRYNKGMQNASLNTQHLEPWSRWAPAAEDHTGCRCCQLSPKLDNRRLKKTLSGLISLDFCWDIQVVGSEFGVKNMKAWIILPCLNGSGWWWWCNGVGVIFLAHFGPLSTNWASFKLHSLLEYCCWPCPSLYDYSVPIFWCTSSRIMHHVTKLKSSQTGFLNMCLIKWPESVNVKFAIQ